MNDAAARAFADLMQGKLDPERIAESVRAIAAAQTQYPAVGRITVEAFYINVKLELTPGGSHAFQGKGGILSATGNVEVGGNVYTADAARMFAATTGFTMTGDGQHLYFLDNNLGALGHFAGTATGTKLGPSPGIGTGSWFAI